MYRGRPDLVKYFTNDELAQFFGVFEKKRMKCKSTIKYKKIVRDEAIYKIMYYCALRVTEVLSIRCEYYNPVQEQLYCSRLKNGISNTLSIVNKNILGALNRHIKVNKPQNYLFENFSGSQLSRKTIYTEMQKYCEYAGLKNENKWHCHTLRHTRAVDLLDLGASIYDVKYWLGHVDITNTQIYLSFTSKQQERLYQRIMNQEFKITDKFSYM